jgi:hypothetical protein
MTIVDTFLLYVNHIMIMTDHSTTTPVKGYGKYGGYEVGELLKMYANLIGMEIDTLMHASPAVHHDGSRDTSHTTSNLIDPIHCQCFRGTGSRRS